MKLHIPDKKHLKCCFFQFFDSIFLKVLQLQSPETQTKNVVFNCQQNNRKIACLEIFKSISTHPQRIFEPTQALNLFASIQRNAPQWVRKLQNLCCGYSCQYNSILFTSLKFMQHTKFMQHVKRSFLFFQTICRPFLKSKDLVVPSLFKSFGHQSTSTVKVDRRGENMYVCTQMLCPL